jgi:endonuclease/exonuclease/phosphatase family metal-dependent hydrolase
LPKSGTASATSSEQATTLRFATFNAGLAVGILNHAVERAPRVAEALGRQPVDVLCVQEFWFDTHWRELVRAVGERLSEQVRPEPLEAQKRAACTAAETKDAAACVTEHCGSRSALELARCAVDHCKQFASDLSPLCMSCLSRDPLRSAEEIFGECVQPSAEAAGDPSTTRAKARKAMKPARPSYYYGGSYGTGLLTSQRVLEREIFQLPSTQHPRAVIYARIDTRLAGELHVFCTHLTPVMNSVPYSGAGSWEREQAEQVTALLSFVAKKSGEYGRSVVLGDLNSGPAVPPNVRASEGEQYRRFVEHGFENPFIQSRHVQCTFCYDNPVINGSGSGGLLIDHILTRNLHLRAAGWRILDEPLPLVVNGREVRSAYSDHYGLLLELRDHPKPSARLRRATTL